MNYLLNHRTTLIQFALAILLLAACGPRAASTKPGNSQTPGESTRTPVVIDSDMGSNGVMAILYLLQRPEFSVEAITISGTGETHCGPGIAHARGMIAMLEAGDIPVACGRETPLTGTHQFPPTIRAAADSSLGITWPTNIPDALNNQLTAVDLLQKTIESAARPVIVVADGPLTNLAGAFQADPKLADNIQMVYIMGGAFDVPGNIFGVPLTAPNKTAEFNMFIDPHAANIVLNSSAPITIVPLDATNLVPLDKTFYKLLSNHQSTVASKAVYAMLTESEVYNQGLYFWDPLTYAIASDESLTSYTTKVIIVVEEEGPEIGRTKISQAGKEVRVAMTVEADRFIETYLSTLNGGQKIAIDWAAARATPIVVMTVTISGGKCVLDGPRQVPAGEFGIKLIDKDLEGPAALAYVTIDEGKTFSDLDAYPSLDPPPWLQVLGLIETDPAKETLLTAEVKDEPIYLICFDSPPQRKIGVIGPIELIK